MKWIEAINLELTTPVDSVRLYDMFEEVKSAHKITEEPTTKVGLYRSTRADNVWSILLHRETPSSPPRKTTIGKNFANSARKLGIVDHALWKKTG